MIQLFSGFQASSFAVINPRSTSDKCKTGKKHKRSELTAVERKRIDLMHRSLISKGLRSNGELKVNYYMNAISLKPDCPLAMELLGAHCYENNNHESALFYLRNARELRGGRDQLHEDIQRILDDLENPLDATWIPEHECTLLDC